MSPLLLTKENTCAVQFADNFDFFETEIEDEVDEFEFDNKKANECFGSEFGVDNNLEKSQIGAF